MILEILMSGHFPKVYKAVAEAPKTMLTLSDTTTSPFGYSCAARDNVRPPALSR
jgi:hypothetical protein